MFELNISVLFECFIFLYTFSYFIQIIKLIYSSIIRETILGLCRKTLKFSNYFKFLINEETNKLLKFIPKLMLLLYLPILIAS